MNDGKIIIEVKGNKVNSAIDKNLKPIEAVQLLIGMAQSVLSKQSEPEPKVKKPSLKDKLMLNQH